MKIALSINTSVRYVNVKCIIPNSVWSMSERIIGSSLLIFDSKFTIICGPLIMNPFDLSHWAVCP
jgi:hypothetical protein